MKRLSIKDIIKFRGKSAKDKKSFVTAFKAGKKEIDSEGGGDYWISCLSAISNSYKLNDIQPIVDKKDELEKKYEETEYERTKIMYKRNIDILYNYEDLDLKKWRPSKKMKILKKHKDDSILSIKGLPVQATPNHIFVFQKGGIGEIGGIWFIAKLNGYRKEELGMFADILHRYLKTHFSVDYQLNAKYCIAVDVFSNFDVNYSQLETGEIPIILNSTLDEIKGLM